MIHAAFIIRVYMNSRVLIYHIMQEAGFPETDVYISQTTRQ